VVQGPSQATASDLLRTADDGGALGEARTFLRSELAGGARPAKEVKAVAREADIAEITLRRAREIECISKKEPGPRGRWLWELKAIPSTDSVQDDHLDHPPVAVDNRRSDQPDPADQGDQDDQGRNDWDVDHDLTNGHDADAELERLMLKFPDIGGLE
jgi:hypothetical protein